MNSRHDSNPDRVSRRVNATYGDARTEGALEVVEYTQRARARRALFVALRCLGVTVVCACIPAAHFVLVPLSLLMLPIFVTVTYRARSEIVGAAVGCPQCGGPLTVLSTRERYPLIENCATCHRPISVRLSSSDSIKD